MKIEVNKIIDPNLKKFVKHWNCFSGTTTCGEEGWKCSSWNFSIFGKWLLSIKYNKQYLTNK